ncbi:MAG: 30S ribosomal protein S12 methylthiotransferase RimO [Bacteroidales bacterium]|nr:30S ribosomal protein S12 methylthiotransferase RimO [Bacteroidales bacterium]
MPPQRRVPNQFNAKPTNLKISLITLGCSKNRVDSEHILSQLSASDVEIVPEGATLEGQGVDALLINTCGFIHDAKQESIETILSAVELKKRGIVGKVYVFGCLAQRYKADLTTEIPEVDAFFGVDEMPALYDALGVGEHAEMNEKRLLTTPSHYAYLKISEGCDRSCSYCAIPSIRGKHKSVPMEKLVKEAENLAASGVKELIVIAQDTTWYGLDLYGKRALGELLERLSAVDGIEWIRLHYSYPASFPDDVVSQIAQNPKICKYIDIPLQHISTDLLKKMRRSIDADGTKALIKKFRLGIPGVALRTTMIVGHPGEGRKEFNELIKFIKEYRFERLGAFTYSEEEGTYGAIHYKDTVTKRTKERRYGKLMEIQSAISFEYNLSRVGSVEKVLIDSYVDGKAYGRTQKESPEVDGEVIITSKKAIKPGTFVNVLITDADCYDLYGKIV